MVEPLTSTTSSEQNLHPSHRVLPALRAQGFGMNPKAWGLEPYCSRLKGLGFRVQGLRFRV